MIIFRRARGTVGRSLGAVTEALDCLGADAGKGHQVRGHQGASGKGHQVQRMPAGDRGVSRGRAAQHAGPHQNMPSLPIRIIMGKAADGTAEQSESVSNREKVAEVGSGTASGTTAGSETSESHSKDETDTEMGEDKFQNVLLAAAMKHVVRIPHLQLTYTGQENLNHDLAGAHVSEGWPNHVSYSVTAA